MTEPRITVLLVDDHSLVRRGFRRMLEDDPGITVVGEAEDGRGKHWEQGKRQEADDPRRKENPAPQALLLPDGSLARLLLSNRCRKTRGL